MGRRARGRDHGRSSHRPPPAPLPHRQHPRQQLPDESPPGPAAIGVARKPSRSRVVTTTTRRRAAGPGSASGRSAPYVRPRTAEGHRPTAIGATPNDPSQSVQFSVATSVQFSVAIDTRRSPSVRGCRGKPTRCTAQRPPATPSLPDGRPAPVAGPQSPAGRPEGCGSRQDRTRR